MKTCFWRYTLTVVLLAINSPTNATLRLIFESPKVTIAPLVAPAPLNKAVSDVVAEPKVVTQAVPAKPASAPAKTDSKCFDDLLSASLGDNDPSTKERLRKTKCQ